MRGVKTGRRPGLLLWKFRYEIHETCSVSISVRII
ncbi:hypothetical protein MTE2_4610 [Klebsiella pneumoniae VA360]|nr:hypothetical protein MTE2_4610 [Klebsiella pneumoniae VA360]